MKRSGSVKFVCPKDGKISRDEVAFLCNRCEKRNLMLRDDIFFCPECLTEGENFQCMICGSKEVKVAIGQKETRRL